MFSDIFWREYAILQSLAHFYVYGVYFLEKRFLISFFYTKVFKQKKAKLDQSNKYINLEVSN